MSRSIEVTTHLRTSYGRARELLLRDPGAVLGVENERKPSPRTFLSEMAVPVGRAGAVRQAVQIHILAVHLDDHAAAWDLAWTALDHPKLFPVFHGTLRLVEGPKTALRLGGSYDPPLGAAGRWGNGIFGHRFARRSLADFLDGVAGRIDRAALRDPAVPAWFTVREPLDR